MLGISWECRHSGGRHRPEIGGSSSSSSQSATTTSNIDKRQVVSDNALGVTADNSTINVSATDHGAVNAAIDLAKTADANASTNLQTLAGAMIQLSQQAIKSLDTNTQLAKDLTASTQSAYSDATSQANGNKNLVYVGLAVLGIAAVKAFGKA